MPSSVTRRSMLAALLAGGLGTSPILAACGGGNSSSQVPASAKQTISFWDDTGGTNTPFWKKLIADFEKQNPHIKVSYLGLPEDSAVQKYDTAISGGATPDVGKITSNYLAGIVAQQALIPLDDAPLIKKLMPILLTSIRNVTPDKKLYTLPIVGNTQVIYYRADWFKQARIKPPTTWDEFFTAAYRLTNPGEHRYGYTIRGGAGSISPLMSMMYAYSGVPSFFKGDTSTLDDPKNAEFVAKYAKLYKRATSAADLNSSFTQMVAAFDGGGVAMLEHNLTSAPDHRKALGDKVAATVLPSNPKAPTMTSAAVDGLGIFKRSSHQAAAKKLVNFLLSAESNGYYAQQTAQIPANIDAQSAAWIANEPALKLAIAQLQDKNLTVAETPEYLPDWATITKTDMEPPWQKVLLGQLSVKAFLSQFADAADKALKQYKEHQ